ncbi:MAG: cytochrome C oxidase subunit IV family protein [Chloroflexota bacterium]|nr:cytochrome C oxidase subunit IV family protein [Chloroflexota bacterium]MDE2941325.1 cytochrome C oxidase subunit IV family protein [Chloroflexota bacterium]MDE3268575.1 cytochrome C oxidase subunit IV family protein [Chloroflexota bacterium]
MEHGRHPAHPTPMTYLKVAAILAIVTFIEWAIFFAPESMDSIKLTVFSVLSVMKFALVVMFYMHLKFDERLFSMFFVGGLTLASGVIIALLVLFQALL